MTVHYESVHPDALYTEAFHVAAPDTPVGRDLRRPSAVPLLLRQRVDRATRGGAVHVRVSVVTGQRC